MNNIVPKKDKKLGICHHYVINHIRYLKHLVTVCAKELNLYSGDDVYPIASGNLNQEPQEIFCSTSNLWDRRTKYGRNRIAVCELYIQKFNVLVDEYVKVKDVDIETITKTYPENHAVIQLLTCIIDGLPAEAMKERIDSIFKLILKEVHKHGRI